MNTNDKAALYYLSISTDREGSQRVGRNELMSLFGCSNPTVDGRINQLLDLGYCHCVKVPFAVGRGNGYKWQYWISAKGEQALGVYGDTAKSCYDLLIASKLEAAINRARKISNNGKPKKVHAKQMKMELK